ncbi:hypothetical protein lerEdw1_017624 [Lerista edwardsae]|nr:hypothetical protein lerEdw1_017624 [Lerista edwardsae]
MRSARSEILSLISSALWMMCLAVPLMAYSGDPRFFSKNMEFAHKIRSDVVAMKERLHAKFRIVRIQNSVFSNELQLMRELVAIPSLNCDSDPCNLEDCFNQIRAGLHTYEGYLSQIADALPSYADRVRLLRLDVWNLSANIQQQMEETGLPTVTYPQANQVLTKLGNQNWKDVVRSYIILDDLKEFLEMTIRALRHCST